VTNVLRTEPAIFSSLLGPQHLKNSMSTVAVVVDGYIDACALLYLRFSVYGTSAPKHVVFTTYV
jgi:hypothetical protein